MLGIGQLGDERLRGLAVVQHAGNHGIAEVHEYLRAALHGNAGGHGRIVGLHLSAILRHPAFALGEGRAQDKGEGQQGNQQDHCNALHESFLLID